MSFPQTWENKKSKQRMRAMPWWETVPDTAITDTDMKIPEVDVPWKFGMLVQIGWLLENETGVWFGVSSKAKELFNVVEPKVDKKKRARKR